MPVRIHVAQPAAPVRNLVLEPRWTPAIQQLQRGESLPVGLLTADMAPTRTLVAELTRTPTVGPDGTPAKPMVERLLLSPVGLLVKPPIEPSADS